jgi:hypothetical protein
MQFSLITDTFQFVFSEGFVHSLALHYNTLLDSECGEDSAMKGAINPA